MPQTFEKEKALDACATYPYNDQGRQQRKKYARACDITGNENIVVAEIRSLLYSMT